MDRRAFLALLSAPALVPLLQSCGKNDGTTDDIVDGNGFRFLASSRARASGSETDALDGARALNLFGADVYGKLAASAEPNLVFSPASIMLALAMTRAGARGATAAEMDAALRANEASDNEAGFHRAVNSLSATLESRNGVFEDSGSQKLPVTVSIVNSLWGQDQMTWNSDFLDVLAGEYGAGMRVVDYVTRTEEARRAINGWVKDETRNRIPELLGSGTLNTDIRLVLVNAIYMKAPWATPFPEQSTTDSVFTTLGGSTAMVPMMRTSVRCDYARGDSWQAVDLPYISGNLSMTMIVPDAGTFAEVEAAVAAGLVTNVVAAMGVREVNLAMPKFDLETKVDLKSVMKELGMQAAFDPSVADFSGMTDDVELFVSFIVHQANITVDEKGTEAAAATAVGAGATSSPTEPVTLEIDRPFLYAVRDRPTGAVLFLGRVGDPR